MEEVITPQQRQTDIEMLAFMGFTRIRYAMTVGGYEEAEKIMHTMRGTLARLRILDDVYPILSHLMQVAGNGVLSSMCTRIMSRTSISPRLTSV